MKNTFHLHSFFPPFPPSYFPFFLPSFPHAFLFSVFSLKKVAIFCMLLQICSFGVGGLGGNYNSFFQHEKHIYIPSFPPFFPSFFPPSSFLSLLPIFPYFLPFFHYAFLFSVFSVKKVAIFFLALFHKFVVPGRLGLGINYN